MKIDSAWPNDAQQTLLNAALFPPEEAEKYWHEFIEKFDLQKLDHGCNQILPMVFINLKDWIKKDVNERTCLSSYKYVWANNHLLMHDLKSLLMLLKQQNIKICLLKGAAYIGHYFPDYGMRIMGDIDLLVSPKKMPELIELMESNGYKITSNQDNADSLELMNLFHAKSFKNQRGTEFDVHQYISKFLVDEKFTEKVWGSAKSINLFENKDIAYVLSPSYQLIHTVIHGLQYAPVSSVRWIVDAANLLKNHCDEIDWNELEEVCSSHHLNLPMKLALNYLYKELKLPIPVEVISYFNSINMTDRDEEYYNSSSNIGIRYALVRMKRSWEHYKIYTSKNSKRINIFGLYDFLVLYLHLESRWALLPHITIKACMLLVRVLERTVKRIFHSGKQFE